MCCAAGERRSPGTSSFSVVRVRRAARTPAAGAPATTTTKATAQSMTQRRGFGVQFGAARGRAACVRAVARRGRTLRVDDELRALVVAHREAKVVRRAGVEIRDRHRDVRGVDGPRRGPLLRVLLVLDDGAGGRRDGDGRGGFAATLPLGLRQRRHRRAIYGTTRSGWRWVLEPSAIAGTTRSGFWSRARSPARRGAVGDGFWSRATAADCSFRARQRSSTRLPRRARCRFRAGTAGLRSALRNRS